MDTSTVVMLRNTLFTGILPVLAVFGTVVLAWKPWSHSKPAEPTRKLEWYAPVGLAVGYVLCHLGVQGLPELSPTNSTDWLVHIGLLGAALGLFETFNRKLWLTWLVRFIAIRLALWLVLNFMFEHHWSGREAVLWLDAMSAGLVVSIGSLDSLARQKPGPLVPGLLVVIGIAASLILVNAETASIAQLIGGLTAACGGAFIASIWDRSISFARGFSTAFMLVLASLFISGYFLVQDPPTGPAALLLSGPILLWLGLTPFAEKYDQSWTSTAAQIALIIVPVVVALGLSFYPPGEPGAQDSADTESGTMYDNLE